MKNGKYNEEIKNRMQKKKKTKILPLFLAVLAGVLVCGGIFLAFLYGSQLRQDEAALAAGAGEKEDVLAKDSDRTGQETGGSLLDKLVSEAVDFQAEAELEAKPSRYGSVLALPEEELRAQKIYGMEGAAADSITMAFAGDILFDEQYAVMASLLRKSGSVEDAFSQELLVEMRAADIFMVNNEFTYTRRGAPVEGKQFTFRANPQKAALLRDMGVDIVSLANNHAYDYGEISLLDTLDTLEALPVAAPAEQEAERMEEKMQTAGQGAVGMPYVGAGRNLEEARKPAYFIVNDTKIAVVSATQIERSDNPDTKGATDNGAGTFRCWNVDNLLETVAAAKANSDFVVVYIHWGTENTADLDWAQREQAPKIAQAGADIIIGDHPHCLQPVGFVDGVPVIYSLGNFWFNSKSLDTCLVKVMIPAGELAQTERPLVQVLPARQQDCFTSLAAGAERTRILQYLNAISEGAYLDEEGYLREKE